MLSPGELLLRAISVRDEADAVSRSLLKDQSLVGPLSLPVPRLDPPELGFLRAVAWAYVHYYEAGAVGFKFLTSLFDTYETDIDGRGREHFQRAGRLRTYLQHNLDPTRVSDAATIDAFEAWAESVCGSRVPGTADHWAKCLSAFLEELVALLEATLRTLRCLEDDREDREAVLVQWRHRASHHRPAADFDPVIEIVAADMGRPSLNVVAFRNRHYDRWAEAVRGLEGEFDFELEARRLVELSMLRDVTAVLPITGRDILTAFEIPPGPEVGRLLERARILYENRPCSGDDLLAALLTEHSGTS